MSAYKHLKEKQQWVFRTISRCDESHRCLDEIVCRTDYQQWDNEIEEQLLPEHFAVGFLPGKETGNEKEQGNAEDIDVYVIERREMSIDDKSHTDSFHPVYPVETCR